MLRLAIAGCHGKMGKALIQAALQSDVVVTCATVSANHPLLDTDVGTIAGVTPLHFKPVDDLSKIIEDFDLLIDFTSIEATLSHLEICCQHQKKMVIGTTGFNPQQKNHIQQISKTIPIVFSPNMSVGIQLCLQLLKQAAQVLGEKADVEIIEAHHRHKIDAPSGTALLMGETISNVRKQNLNDVSLFNRHDKFSPRDHKTIGFSSIRAGDIVGDHTVLFAQIGEQIEITHRASNRQPFAFGALRAAMWLADKSSGLYSMQDVIS